MGEYRTADAPMRAYVAVRITETARLLAQHRGGACARCGGRAPCPEADDAARLHEHYQQWLDAASSWPGHDHDGGDRVLIRPYVPHGGRDAPR